MAKPLRLFIEGPYTGQQPAWSLLHGYGPTPQPAGSTEFQTTVVLETSGPGTLLAAADGKLSTRPPAGGVLDPTEEVAAPAPADGSPEVVDLYLHLSPAVGQRSEFVSRAGELSGIAGFRYAGITTTSLSKALGELLDKSVFPHGALTRDDILKLFLAGDVDVWVTAGHQIGAAAPHAGSGKRRAGFAALTGDGPSDPAYVYDWMRDFVEDGESVLDEFLGLVPKRWPLIDPALSTPDAIARTATTLYSSAVLVQLRRSRALTRAQWRQVGDNQKALWRRRLLRRAGQAPANVADPPFQFDDVDWSNIFQLEALVEFYANFDDPHRANAAPAAPRDQGYVGVDFIDPGGTVATANGTAVTLDAEPDLSRVVRGHDVLHLDGDTNPKRPTHAYMITKVDEAARTVTVDGSPVLPSPSEWHISLRPVVVFVDSFGPRAGLRGTHAVVAAPTLLELDGAPDLNRVNADYDTVYLAADTARGSRTYRITGKDNSAHTVTLDGAPSLADGSSSWYVTAGVGGDLSALDYKLGPNNPPNSPDPRGNDHYDANAFVVHNGSVHTRVRFSTLTSRNKAGQSLSSVRGNRRYTLSSFFSGGSTFRSFCFKVADLGESYDGIREARYYFRTPVTEDHAYPPHKPVGGGAGKGTIRIHRGSRKSKGTGSEGCLVSPLYKDLRDKLILRYQRDYVAVHAGGVNAQIQKLFGLTYEETELLHEKVHPIHGELPATEWNDKILGTVWIIRPDERPLGPLIANPSFETDTSGWTAYREGGAGDVALARDETWGAQGTSSLRVTATAHAGNARAGAQTQTDADTVTAGSQYRLTARVHLLDPPPRSVNARIAWQQANGQPIQPVIEGTPVTGAAEATVTVTAEGTAPSGAVRAAVGVYGLSTTAGDTIDFLVDAVQFDVF